jgi:short subunit dehydrogenase
MTTVLDLLGMSWPTHQLMSIISYTYRRPGWFRGGRMRLQGKTAMVTGAGRGIGAAIAEALAAEGAAVAVCDLDGTAAAKTAAGLPERHGARAIGATVDIAAVGWIGREQVPRHAEKGPVDRLLPGHAPPFSVLTAVDRKD